jgi:DNA gyrase inhibitor GyrI
MSLRFEKLPPRRVAVAPHQGPMERIESTRRPLYQHLIMHEAVAGPSMLRFPAGSDQPDAVLVQAAVGYSGAAGFTLQELPGGRHAVQDYEGPMQALPQFRAAFRQAIGAAAEGRPILQVHLYDEVDGVTEQRLELYLD